MTIFENAIRNYWNYYLELEFEYYQTKRYVDFSKENYRTFSIEYLKLYQAVCGEIDSLGKYVASLCNSAFIPKNNKNIYGWWIEIQDVQISNEINSSKKTTLEDFEVKSYPLNEPFKPWENFHVEFYQTKKGETKIKLSSGKKTPLWWKAYNDVKHQRAFLSDDESLNYRKANLENLSNAISALYSLELTLLEKTGTKEELNKFMNKSCLFVKYEWGVITEAEIDELFKDW